LKSDANRERFDGCVSLVDQVRRGIAPDHEPTVEELASAAGGAFQRYAERLLEELLAAADESPDFAEVLIPRQFADAMERAGSAMREALADSRHRHAVAQELQRKMFEVELMLRRAMKMRASAAAIRGIAAS
jgi:hypothetical protein